MTAAFVVSGALFLATVVVIVTVFACVSRATADAAAASRATPREDEVPW